MKELFWFLFVARANRSLPVLVLLLVVAARLRWRRRSAAPLGRPRAGSREPSTPCPELADLLAMLDGHWARQGFPRPASRAPLEHLMSLPPQSLSAELREAARSIILCFYRGTFGGVAIENEEIRRICAQWDRALGH